MRNPLQNALKRKPKTVPASPEPVQPVRPKAEPLSPDGLQIVSLPSGWMRSFVVPRNYAQIYASQYNVRAAVDVIAREAASLQVHVFESIPRTDKGSFEGFRSLPNAQLEIEQHPLRLLLDTPSPGMAHYRFFYGLFADLLIYDVAHLWKIRVKGQIRALLRIPPQNLTIERDPITQTPRLYRAIDGRPIPLRDVVTFWGYDPATNDGYVPPMETLRRLLAEETSAGLDREGRWRNSSRKDGVIERTSDSEAMTDDQVEAFYLDLEDSTGGAGGSGRPVVLQPGMSWKDVQWSPRELEYINARKLSRTEVAGFYHMPAAMMSAAQQGQEPNKETLSYFYTHTLPPWLNRVEHELDAQLLPEYELTPERLQAVYTQFNLDEKLRGSFEERISILATAAGGPIITVNEARAREGLPPIAGGDLIFVPLNSIRAGGPQGSPRSPVETPADGIEPAGTTPGGGVQQASLADFQAGRAVALGTEDAQKLIYGGESIEDVLQGVEDKAAQHELDVYLAGEQARYEEKLRAVLEKTFDRQKRAKTQDSERWNRELADDLFATFYQATEVVGTKLAELQGLQFDATRAGGLLRGQAEVLATNANENTKRRLEEAGPESAYSGERASQDGMSLAEWLCGWLSDEVTRQNELEISSRAAS